MHVPERAAEAADPARTRWSRAVLAAGLLAIVLVVFGPAKLSAERFSLPKELVLDLATLLVALFCLPALGRLRIGWLEGLLLAALLSSTVSALFVASNSWAGLRALASTASATGLFLWGRHLSDAGARESLLRWVGLAAVVVAGGVFLEAYALIPRLALTGRAPAWTLGNRNYAAHFLVGSLPLLLIALATAPRKAEIAKRGAMVALVVAGLVLTRSRGAWLAAALTLGVGLAAVSFARLGQRVPTLHRLALVLAIAAGIGSVLLVPPRLAWSSSRPYWDTVKALLDTDAGSGRGRVIQYRRTLAIIADHPVLGVGPGNWALAYPRYAQAGDPVYKPEWLAPVPRFPNSDVLGVAAERGLVVLGMWLLAALFLIRSLVRRLARARRGAGEPDPWRDVAGLMLIAGLFGAGLTDAVLLRAEPLYLAAITLGVLSPRASGRELGSGALPWIKGAVIAVALAATAFSVSRLVAGHLRGAGALAVRERALRFDPGNHALALELAVKHQRAGNCQRARHFAGRTLQLTGYSVLASAVLKGCDRSAVHTGLTPPPAR
jgi:putative inorganic carbon (hco3(-)) transporter